MRIKLVIAYDGRGLAGWQSQAGGNTVQDHIEQAISVTAGGLIRIHGSGRTDAGVHAVAQVAHFDAPEGMMVNPHNWVPSLNVKLPASIRILSAVEAPPGFHARFSAVEKTYRYRIRTEPVLSPFHAGLAWHVPRLLDPDTLRDALGRLAGRHRFAAFSAFRGNESVDTDYWRTIRRADLEEHDAGYDIVFSADGFLYKMIRFMTGTAVRCAQGKHAPSEITRLLEQAVSASVEKAPYCAPPDGLCLEEVRYGEEGS